MKDPNAVVCICTQDFDVGLYCVFAERRRHSLRNTFFCGEEALSLICHHPSFSFACRSVGDGLCANIKGGLLQSRGQKHEPAQQHHPEKGNRVRAEATLFPKEEAKMRKQPVQFCFGAIYPRLREVPVSEVRIGSFPFALSRSAHFPFLRRSRTR